MVVGMRSSAKLMLTVLFPGGRFLEVTPEWSTVYIATDLIKVCDCHNAVSEKMKTFRC